MLNGFALHEIICDHKNNPINYKFLEVNPAFEKMTGLKARKIIGKTVLEVLPETEPYWIDTYGKVSLNREPIRFENYSKELEKYFEVLAYSPKKGKTFPVEITINYVEFGGNAYNCAFARDISDRKQVEKALKESEKNTD